MSTPDDPVPFTPYDKIASSPRDWGLDERDARAVERAQWVVTEKIHGANFCAVSDGESVRFAKRKAVLEEGEAFFGWEALREDLEAAALAVAAALLPALDGATHVLVYGELFGGGYPHPEVPEVPGVAPIQTGVWYAPGVRFHAFDVAWTAGEEGARTYLGYEQARQACVGAGLGWCEALLVGSLAEAMEHPVRFQTTLPAELGLPELGDNLAEGVVLKPYEALELGGARPVLKRKIAEFAEDARYQGARAWAPPLRLAWALDLIEWEVTQRVNRPRVDAALSKIGARPGDPGPALERWADEVADEVARDVFDELAAAQRDALAGLDADERAFAEALARELAREVALT